MPGLRAVCVHGHFYQPPRDHPWLGVIEPQPSAFPERDWNVRVSRECYGPTAAARVLDGQGRLLDVVNCYEWTSFNVGPTLMEWLAAQAPDVLAAMREADARTVARTGHGAAWAQAYGHPILPLSSPRDAATQIRWGVADFRARFGRDPEGMWLPEMAVDVPSLIALADAGITLTMLAPHQARRVRPLGAGADEWRAVTAQTLDVRRLYRCRLPGGRSIDVVFRDPGISHDLSFGGLLADGWRLAARLRDAALGGDDDDALVTASVDGETWGHHHRFGEMALAYALRALRADPEVELLPPAAFRARRPPELELQVWERTAWSCGHGIERWRSDCGCNVGAGAGWNQAWRGPLRQAIDWLRDELALVYQAHAHELLRDPCAARDRYIEVILEPGRRDAWLAAEARRRLTARQVVAARRTLEMARHALLMQTSCGWFFDDLANIETVHNLAHAARAIELAEQLGTRLETDFVDRLDAASSNCPEEGNGAEVWRRRVQALIPRPARVAATSAMLAVLERPLRLPGYAVQLSASPVDGSLFGTATVVETTTGASFAVPVVARRAAEEGVLCEAGGEHFALGDLFGVQRELVLASVSREAVHGAREGRRASLARVQLLLEPLLADGISVPRDLAVIVGWDEAERLVHAVRVGTPPLPVLTRRAARLYAQGVVYPARWLSENLGATVERETATLPDGAGRVLALLDLAEAAGIVLDLAPAQIRLLRWWQGASPDDRAREPMLALRDRLALSPDVG